MPAINAMYAWVAREANGDEGVVGAYIPALGGMVPLVGADMERIQSLRAHAEAAAAASGAVIKLVRFSGREVLEELVR